MAIITSGDLSDLYNQRTFRANGSTVTLKKISETDWLLFGDIAEGDSEGFGDLTPQGLAPGDEFEGGYFVGVSFDGNYNLFVSKGEIGSYKFSQSDYAPYTSADSETDGYYNTQQILNTSSSYAFPAAQACDEHFSDGFGGWFLPSRYELGLLFDNSSHIPLVLPRVVWTSEDRTDERSLTFHFTGSFPGTTSATYKRNTHPVYAFRRVPR